MLLRFRLSLAVLSLLLSLGVMAQVPTKPVPANPAILKAVDTDVWIPFSKAYSDMKADPYIALHSKSLIRIMGDVRYVEPYGDFVKNMNTMFDNLSKQKAKISIEFRFTERIVNADTASERGFYEFTITDAAGRKTKIYSRFHTFLKKEGGKWKIVMDYDSNERGTVNEAAFKAAFARDDYAKY